jgi:hypothetical protein
VSEHKGKCCGECTWDGVPDKCCCKTINITNVYNSPTKKKIQEKQRDNLIELGVLRERQRIIKLLQEYEVMGVNPKTRLMLNEDALIALIKEK